MNSRVTFETLLVAHIISSFKESQSSFILSKVTASGHCPEPAQSGLYNRGITIPLVNKIVTMKRSHAKTLYILHRISPKSLLILSLSLHLDILEEKFLSEFPTNIFMDLYFI
jgi:hypothetical protein